VDFDRSLNKAMAKLRSALADSAENPRYVETIPRHGYRFLAPVRADPEGPGKNGGLHPQDSPGSDARAAARVNVPSFAIAGSVVQSKIDEATTAAGASPAGSEIAWHRSNSRRSYLIACAAVLAVLAGLAYLRAHQPVVLGGSSSTVSPRHSVAVLGFKNLSGDPQEAWLSTAFSDWLMTELTAGEQLRAIPGESIARMRMELALPDVDSLSRESLARIRKNLGTDGRKVGRADTPRFALAGHAHRRNHRRDFGNRIGSAPA
jgi:TolB-like protein